MLLFSLFEAVSKKKVLKKYTIYVLLFVDTWKITVHNINFILFYFQIKQLRRLTCQNMRYSCLRLMKAILPNELAINYSWFGAKKKQNFSNLEICKIIISKYKISLKAILIFEIIIILLLINNSD